MISRFITGLSLLAVVACEPDKRPISTTHRVSLPQQGQPHAQPDTLPLQASQPKPDTLNNSLTEQMRMVRAHVRQLNAVREWDKEAKRNLHNSTDGGEATYYYQAGRLAKIVARDYGESGQWLREYYLLPDGQLAFVFEKDYTYNQPYYYDSAQVKEMGGGEVFDFAKSQIKETRSYFHQGQLIQQLVEPPRASPQPQRRLPAEQKRLRADFTDLRQTLNHPD